MYPTCHVLPMVAVVQKLDPLLRCQLHEVAEVHGVTREGVPGTALHFADRLQSGQLDECQLDSFPPSLDLCSLLLGGGILEGFGNLRLNRLGDTQVRS